MAGAPSARSCCVRRLWRAGRGPPGQKRQPLRQPRGSRRHSLKSLTRTCDRLSPASEPLSPPTAARRSERGGAGARHGLLAGQRYLHTLIINQANVTVRNERRSPRPCQLCQFGLATTVGNLGEACRVETATFVGTLVRAPPGFSCVFSGWGRGPGPETRGVRMDTQDHGIDFSQSCRQRQRALRRENKRTNACSKGSPFEHIGF